MHFGISHSTLIDPKLEKKPGNISKDVSSLIRELKTRGIRKLGFEGSCSFGRAAPKNIDYLFNALDQSDRRNPRARYNKALHLKAKRNGISLVALEDSGVTYLFYSLGRFDRDTFRALSARYDSLPPKVRQHYDLIFNYEDMLVSLHRAINVKRTLLMREQAKRKKLKHWVWGRVHALEAEKMFGERYVQVNALPEEEERVQEDARASIEAYRAWKPVLDAWEREFKSQGTIISKIAWVFQRRKK